jgi:Type I phosphodiesterase / nucleotide pyrophosphatase
MHPEYIRRADQYQLKIPVLRRLFRDGSHAHAVRGVLATVTFPSHTTLLTGVSPARHGITLNIPEYWGTFKMQEMKLLKVLVGCPSDFDTSIDLQSLRSWLRISYQRPEHQTYDWDSLLANAGPDQRTGKDLGPYTTSSTTPYRETGSARGSQRHLSARKTPTL